MSSGDFGSGLNDRLRQTHTATDDGQLKITSKPIASYTDSARKNCVQGSVRLKVALLANGKVGLITPVKTLTYGLTEQAIEAARKIKFKPKTVNGQPVSVVVTFDYSFNIY